MPTTPTNDETRTTNEEVTKRIAYLAAKYKRCAEVTGEYAKIAAKRGEASTATMYNGMRSAFEEVARDLEVLLGIGNGK